MNVIDLFEESCITDWVGPMEATVEQSDGVYRSGLTPSMIGHLVLLTNYK